MTTMTQSNMLILGAIMLAGCLSHPIETHEKKFDSQNFGDANFFNTMFRPKQERLGLEDLRNGFDSLQLRIWWHHSFCDSGDVYVIKKKPGEDWASFRLRFPVDPEIMNFTADQLISDRGAEIWENLSQLGIREFKGMDSLTLGRYADGEMVIIEIATKTGYRQCCSQSSFAYSYKDEADEVKRATNFLAYMTFKNGISDRNFQQIENR